MQALEKHQYFCSSGICNVRKPSDDSTVSDDLVYLCLETVIYGHSVLIFCPTKNWCEKMAKNVAKEFFNLATSTEKDHNKAFVRTKIRENIQEGPIKDALEHLKRCPAGLVILSLINVNIYQNSFIFQSLSF